MFCSIIIIKAWGTLMLSVQPVSKPRFMSSWICGGEQWENLLLSVAQMKKLCVLKKLHQLSVSHGPSCDIS